MCALLLGQQANYDAPKSADHSVRNSTFAHNEVGARGEVHDVHTVLNILHALHSIDRGRGEAEAKGGGVRG